MDIVQLTLERTVDSVKQCRDVVRDSLSGWPHGLADDAVLAASELVSNAVVHGQEPIVLTLERGVRRLRVAVSDGGPSGPETRRPDANEESGRGLTIVAAVAHRWGVEAAPTGKLAWFELDSDRPNDNGRAR
jgi:anti-sigma regulatory factor (Ser/Thr protein kinase)